MSTKPGVTDSPSPSSSSLPRPDTLPTAAMVPSFTATSPTNGAPPLPSMIVPPLITMSNSLAMSPIPFINCRPPKDSPSRKGRGSRFSLLCRDAKRTVDHLVQRRLDLALEDIDRLDHPILRHLRIVIDHSDVLARQHLPLLDKLRA